MSSSQVLFVSKGDTWSLERRCPEIAESSESEMTNKEYRRELIGI